MAGERLLQCFHRIIRQGERGVGEGFRHARGISDAESSHAAASLNEERIDVAVIAAFKLDGEIAASKSTSDAESGHGGFGPGIDQPDHLHRWNGVADFFRQLNFAFSRCAKTGADRESVLNGGEDLRMPMPDEHGAPGANKIDVLVAIDVPKPRTIRASHETRSAANAAECAHRRIHTSRN